MITWVLLEEPSPSVRRAIEVMEERVGSISEVMWLCPGEIAEPAQD